jgi:ketosteroid isomerase-like protein
MRFSDYMTAFNRGDDRALIREFWTEDCVMQSAGRTLTGHAEMIGFLDWAHDGVREIMRPQVVVEDGEWIFAEIDMDFHALTDKPDYVFGPLKAGQSVTVKFFVQYRTRGGKVAQLKSMTWPPGQGVSRPQPRLDGSLAGRQAFQAYAQAFSDGQFETFSRYYAPDVVCELSSLTLTGRDGIVDFYRGMFAKVRETLTVHRLTADDDGLCAEITSTFTAIEDASDFAPMPLARGEVLQIPLFVVYTLRDGLIARIRAVRRGEPVKG